MKKVSISEAADKPTERPNVYQDMSDAGGFGSMYDNPNYIKLSQAFELDASERREGNLSDKLTFLYNWGRQATGSNNISDIVLALKVAKRDLGINSIKGDLVNKLYRWARLDSKKKDIQKEMSALSL